MSRKSKEDWLREGAYVIAEDGAAGLTIDTLCNRLQVTKGSFYHHFKNYQDFKTALLNFWEQESTLRIIEAVEQTENAINKLDYLLKITANFPEPLEKSFRAWAMQDEEVGQYQQRIDQQRMSYVETLCLEVTPTENQAKILARILYTVFVGSLQILPPVTTAEFYEMYSELKRLFKVQGES